MIHQTFKDIYYSLLHPVSKLLVPLYRVHYKLKKNKKDCVQIGCGKNYLDGFVNIDGNILRKVDYVLDVRVGLPFPDNSIKLLYSCHMLEHVHIDEAINILREWYRVLSPTGYIRLTLPDFNYIEEILAGKDEHNFPRGFQSRSGQAVNFLFCDGQHKYAYTKDMIDEIAKAIGFDDVKDAVVNSDKNISIESLCEPPGSFSVNLYKPASE